MDRLRNRPSGPILPALLPAVGLGALMAIVGLAGCAPDPGEEGGPEARGEASGASESAGPATSAEAGVPLPPLPDGPLFVDVTEASGLEFHHFNGMAGAFYMPENLGSGGALIDYDGDGDLDVYLVQGRELGPGARIEDASVPYRHRLPVTDRLYRNDLDRSEGRGLRFTDVTTEAGLPEALYGMGAATGDYDGDGRTDLYVTGFGRNRLLRNVTPPGGAPAFEDVTDAAGVDDPRWSVPAVFFDYDRDGWLDLYVGNYLDFTFETHRPCTTMAGAPDYCDPSAYGAVGDRLFRNLGPGPHGVTFEDVTASAGLGDATGKALGAVAFDADGDGCLDLYVANDGTPNHLWTSSCKGGGTSAASAPTFVDTALLAGCAVNDAGLSEASMGVDAADVDLDGDPDLVMGHFAEETNTLFLNEGGGMFADRSVPSGLAAPSLEANGFGTGWLDVDSDGLLDLLVVNGTVRAVPELVRAGDPYPYHQPNQLFRNLGPSGLGRGEGVRFEEVTGRAGPAFERSEVSRGALLGDLDDDGDTDLVISNSAGPARVLENVAGDGRRWIGVRAVASPPGGGGAGGADVRVDALGARVGLMRDGAPTLWRRVATDGSYASARDPRALFGLGPAGEDGPPPTALRVLWPDGTAEEYEPPPVGAYTEIRKGTGRVLHEGGDDGGGR